MKFDSVYKRYQYRGVQSLFDEAKEILLTLADGEAVFDLTTFEIDTTFNKISPEEAKEMLLQLSKSVVKEFITSQEDYQMQQKPPKKIHRWLTTTNRLIKWQMDLIDVRWLKLDDYQCILSIIDVFSKYAYLIPLRNKEGKTVARKLDVLFSLPDVRETPSKPKLLLSDNGPEFDNKYVFKAN